MVSILRKNILRRTEKNARIVHCSWKFAMLSSHHKSIDDMNAGINISAIMSVWIAIKINLMAIGNSFFKISTGEVKSTGARGE